MPVVSVIMPNFNYDLFIAESIKGVLDQTFDDFELLVIDDCSTDGSREIIRDFARKDKRVAPVFREKNSGSAAACRNAGLERCRGDYVAFCDSDDVWKADKLAVQLECLKGLPTPHVVHSDSIIIDENGVQTGERFSSRYKGKRMSGDLFEDLCQGNFINIQTGIFPFTQATKSYTFEEHLGYLTDWIFFVKLSSRLNFHYMPEPTACYRVHSQSTSHDHKGYSLYRIMAYLYVLQNYGEVLPKHIRSRIFYHIGVNYNLTGDPSTARRYFLDSFHLDRTNWKSIVRMVSLL